MRKITSSQLKASFPSIDLNVASGPKKLCSVIALLLLILFAILPGISMAQGFGGTAPASVKWKQVNTETVRVIFPTGFDSLANRIANVSRVLGEQTSQTIGGKHNKWSILLQNQTTIPNAYVRMAPIVSEFYWTTDQNNFANGTLRWDDNLASHEYRHIQQFSNFNKGFTKVMSFLMGQEGQLLSTGLSIPDYFLEGDAVWQEMLVSSHGRSCLPSFYNGFKSLWLENKNYSWMKLRNGSFKDQVPNHYPLGYQLTAYGYEKYGEDFWQKVTSDAIKYKGVFYPFNKAIERYSGKTYRRFRKDAMESFKEKTLKGETAVTTEFSFLTNEEKNNVVNYQFPNYINEDSLLVTKRSFKDVNSFCIISQGKEKKLLVRDLVIDDYYSFNGDKIVYAAYVADPRYPVTRDYSVLKYVDIHTGKQKQLTKRSKYFSPDINRSGTEILAVNVAKEGVYNLCRIDASNGALIYKVPNPHKYFFTQTKYIDSTTAVSACKDHGGDMALVKVDLINGEVQNLTPFSFGVIGYPFVKGDTVYFNASNQNADKIFAVSLNDHKIYRLTNNINGIYYPMVNSENDLFFSVFTAGGYRLAKLDRNKISWEEFPAEGFSCSNNQYYTDPDLKMAGKGALKQLNGDGKLDPGNCIDYPVTKYKKSFHLFNFHSWRPIMEDPEYGYSVFSDNVLNTFKTTVYYSYNRTDLSHTIGFNSAFGGWFPVLSMGVEKNFDRSAGLGNSETFNAVTLHTGVSIPLQFLGGRTNQHLNFGGGYNIERAEVKNMKPKLLNYFN